MPREDVQDRTEPPADDGTLAGIASGSADDGSADDTSGGTRTDMHARAAGEDQEGSGEDEELGDGSEFHGLHLGNWLDGFAMSP
ncbi:MAG: hypothetical protein IPP57_14235 [Candidatus Obscuribacter sp.]|nr:hypothetical protein [Candidatus Obscuribacter sp.]